MKKFASLIAVMALLAFAGMAFAAANPSTMVGDQAGSAETNIGKVAFGKDAKANLYYFGKEALGDLSVVVSVDFASSAADNDVVSMDAPTLKGANDSDVEHEIDPSAKKTSGATYVDVPVTYDQVSLDKVPAEIKFTNIGTVTGAAGEITGGASLTLTTVDVKDAVKVAGLPTLYTNSETKPTAVEINADDFYIVLPKETNTATGVAVSWDNAPASAVTVALSEDNVLSVSATDALTAADVKSYVGYIVVSNDTGSGAAEKIVISDDKNAQVAGLEVKDVLAKFTLEVKANPKDEIIEALSKDLKAGPNFLTDDSGKLSVAGDSLGTVSSDKSLTITVVSADVTDSKDIKIDVISAALTPAKVSVVDNAAISGDVSTSSTADELKFGLYKYVLSDTLLKSLMPDTTARGAVVPVEHKMDLNFKLPTALGGESKKLTYIYSGTQTTTDKSSSGACSMGAGILALAGLAVVLRKRG